MTFLDCPAYLGEDGAARCGLPAEVRYRFTLRSADGPVESAMIRCPAGHWFSGPIESLTAYGTGHRDRGAALVDSSVVRDHLPGGRELPDGGGGCAVPACRAEPERDVPRPNGAPAYYLGRPAQLWITAVRLGHGRAASQHPAEAITVG
jgi:hypothetical protein